MFFFGWTIEDGTFRLLSSDVGLALSFYLSIVILGLLQSRLFLRLAERLVVNSATIGGPLLASRRLLLACLTSLMLRG